MLEGRARAVGLPPLVCPRCRGGVAAEPGGVACAPCAVSYPGRDGVLDLTVGRSGAAGYDPHYFPTLERVETRHFWFEARRFVILEALRRAVPDLGRRALVDIGCGSGGLFAFLGQSGVRLAGACDAYPQSLELVRKRTDAPLLLVDEGRLPPLGPGQSLLGLFDVLEHLDDDRGMLRFLWSILEPGGVLVLTVPAHAFLFDEMDRLAHHRRRYARAELRAKLEAAGYEVRSLFHFMASLVPLLLVTRTVGRALPWAQAARRRDLEMSVVPIVNPALAALLSVERWALRRGWSFPFGTSLLAVAVRPDAGGPRASADVG